MTASKRDGPLSPDEDRLISIKEVSGLVGLKNSAIYSRVSAKTFPEPVRLSKRCTRWRISAVRRFIESQSGGASA